MTSQLQHSAAVVAPSISHSSIAGGMPPTPPPVDSPEIALTPSSGGGSGVLIRPEPATMTTADSPPAGQMFHQGSTPTPLSQPQQSLYPMLGQYAHSPLSSGVSGPTSGPGPGTPTGSCGGGARSLSRGSSRSSGGGAESSGGCSGGCGGSCQGVPVGFGVGSDDLMNSEPIIDLTHLSLDEQRHILAVMARDEALRKMQDRRILHLKAELQRLRKRGALRPGLDPERSCARCLSPLGRVLNRGAQCPVCRKKVCKDCRLYDSGVVTSPTSGTPTPSTGSGSNNNATHWICVLCQKQLELKATSGQWMQASPSSSSAGSLRGAAAAPAAAAGASALPYGAGGGGGSSGGSLGSYRRRSLQGGSPPVVVSPILSAPNSVPATPQHGSRLPPGSTVLPTPVLPAQLQAAASNPEHIPRKFLAAQAYYKLQQQQSNGGGPSAVSDNIHNDNTNNNNDNNSGCGNVREFVADEGATAAAVAGVTDDRDVSETETASPVDIVVYDDVSLPPRAPSSASIDQPCDLPCADLSHHHNQHHLNHQKHHNLNHQSNYHLTITQPELDVPSAPLKFGPGFDGPSQRQTPPPSRSQSPRTPHRRSPAPRTSSAQPSSPSTSPSPSMNGVPPRWALIDRSPLNNNNLTKGSTGAKTSSQSSLNSDASLGLGSGALSTPHHLPLGATAANAQQTRYNSVNNSHNNTAASKEAVLPPAKPKRFDERAIDCGGGGGGSSNNNNNYNNNNVASLGSKSKGRLAVDQQGSPSGAGGLTSTGNQSPRPAIGLRGNSSAAAASEPANAVAGGPTTGPVQQPPQQPLSGQPVPLSWRARREGAPSPLQLVDSHAGSASPQLGQAGILRQQQQCRPHSSPAAGHGGSTLSSGGSSLSSYSGSGIGAHLGAAITGQRASSPANSDASSKNDESVIFRRVTIKKKVESNSSSTGSGDTQPYKRISTPRGSTGLQGDSHDAEEPSGPGGSPGLRSARFRSRGGRGSDVDSASSNDNLHQLGVFSKSHTSLSTLGSTATVNHPGGRSESMTSVYSAAGAGRYGAVAVTGEVNFGLSYDLRQGVLSVLVREAKNLAAVDEKRNRSDPYVKVYLLPDRSKSGKRKTKVRKHTLNPVFNEVLRFSVERTELTSRTLWLSVWHCDIFGRNDFLGEVMKDLSSDMLETNTSHWYPLQERVDALDGGSLVVGGGLGGPLGGAYKGDLILSLKWAPHDHRPGRGSLHIIVKEASNLQATRSNGTSDPFCKCYLLPDRHKTSKQKTAVVRRSTTPVWNHPFVYHDVSLAELRERALELTIWDYDKITSNDFLGGVRLSLGTGKYQNSLVDWMDAQGEEIRLWRQMLDKPNQWVDGCLLLRASMN